MKNQITVFKVKSDGSIILTVSSYKMRYFGYSISEAKDKFWAYVKAEEKKAIRATLKNIY